MTDTMDTRFAHFDEGDEGVPRGCTGWYHACGDDLLFAEDAFRETEADPQGWVRDNISGPFETLQVAQADLEVAQSARQKG